MPLKKSSDIGKKTAIFLITIYRKFLSPLQLAHCRFYPSCSSYALGAFEKYGAARGFWMTFKRLLRCHPFSKGGYDPV